MKPTMDSKVWRLLSNGLFEWQTLECKRWNANVRRHARQAFIELFKEQQWLPLYSRAKGDYKHLNDSKSHQADDSLTLAQRDHVERGIARVACADRILGEHSKRVDGERLKIFDLKRCSIIRCNEHSTRIPFVGFVALSDSVRPASSEFANFKGFGFAVLINCFNLILI